MFLDKIRDGANFIKNFLNNYRINSKLKIWDGQVKVNSIKIDGKEFIEKPLVYHNKVLVGGLTKLLTWLYGKAPKTTLKKFEEDLYVGADKNEVSEGKIVADSSKPQVDGIMGYNVCLDGSLGGTTLPYARHRKGYDFDNLIPFRMIHVSEKAALFNNLRKKYLHHRYITHDGEQYIQFFTKKCNFTLGIFLDDGNEVPSDPDKNLTTDLDSNGRCTFPVFTDKDELVEFFQLMKAGGGESTCFSATITMMGKPAKYTEDDQVFEAMHDTVVFSRANHASLPKGVNGVIDITYSILHI